MISSHTHTYTHQLKHKKQEVGPRHSQGGPWVRGRPCAPPPLGSPSGRGDRARPGGYRNGDAGEGAEPDRKQKHGEGGGGGVPPGVPDSPLDQETHVDPGRRKTGSRFREINLLPSYWLIRSKAFLRFGLPATADSDWTFFGGGASARRCGCTHHGTWGSVWPLGSWRSCDLQRSKGEVPLLTARLRSRSREGHLPKTPEDQADPDHPCLL